MMQKEWHCQDNFLFYNEVSPVMGAEDLNCDSAKRKLPQCLPANFTDMQIMSVQAHARMSDT